MLLLNDVQDDKRLAYLLGPTLARYHKKGKARWGVQLAVLGTGALMWLFVWELLQRH